jgi:AbrB family looped-hinge helix DNA binding protein
VNLETRLSTKGQIVLPQPVRQMLALRPGDALVCRVDEGAIILTPKTRSRNETQLLADPLTGLVVTDSGPDAPTVTSEQVQAALADFP